MSNDVIARLAAANPLPTAVPPSHPEPLARTRRIVLAVALMAAVALPAAAFAGKLGDLLGLSNEGTPVATSSRTLTVCAHAGASATTMPIVPKYWSSGVWLRACQRPGTCSVASTLPCLSSASIATTDGNGPGTVEANRFWLTGAETTVLPEASIPVTVATPSAAKPANWISGGKTITGRAGEGKVPLRSQPTPLATFDSIAKQ